MQLVNDFNGRVGDRNSGQKRCVDLSAYQLITDADTLAAYCTKWRHSATLAVDTEFIRTDTFWPKVALIQVSDGEKTFLIDPIAIHKEGLLPLKEVLCSDSGPVIILHACYEDLEVFRRMWGSIPQNLFDTQKAAAILGFGLQLGYQKLVAEILQQDVPKGETRSNWLQRPLTDSQLDYAALDVVYLTQLHDILSRALTEKGRAEWVHEEFSRTRALYEKEDDTCYYLKFRNAWRFNNMQLSVLHALSHWREEVARLHDMPRGFLIKDAVLFKLAEQLPENMSELSSQYEIRKQVLRKDGEKLLQIIATARSSQDSALISIPAPLGKEVKPLISALKSAASDVAASHDIPTELLLKKRDIECIVRASFGAAELDLASIIGCWRTELLRTCIATELQQHQALLTRYRAST